MDKDLLQIAFKKGFTPDGDNNYLWDIQTWLRESHLFHIVISPTFGYIVVKLLAISGGREDIGATSAVKDSNGVGYNSYEECLTDGLISAIKLI